MNKQILRLAIPNVLSNLSAPLLSSVDTILMGNLSAIHLGAVGVASIIFNFIYWNFSFLRMGTTGITAQAYGREDEQATIQTLGRATVVGSLIAVLLLALQLPFEQFALWAMKADTDVAPLISDYFRIRIWAAPAALGLIILMGWFFGMQNVYFPLILTIGINIVNIIVSYILVKQMDMGVAGVAYGTVVAQYFGLLLGIALFLSKYQYLTKHFKRESILKVNELRAFLTINRDIFLRTIMLTTAIAFFYRESAAEGVIILAANTVLMQFFSWLSYGVDGFAYAAESLVGKYIGAKNDHATHRAIRLSFVWGMGLAVLYSVTFWLFGINILEIFTDKTPVIQAALPFMAWIIFLPIVSTPCFIWDGVYIGMTASRAMLWSMLVAFPIYLVSYWALAPIFENHALWMAFYILMLMRGLMQQLLFSWKKLSLT